jgi:GNAT superfamily N-acetyltransferase
MSTATGTGEEREVLWKARPFAPGDEDVLARLYETVLERTFEGEKWEWLFGEAASGSSHIMFADHDGVLVGQYATVPMRMQIQGKRVLTSLSLDTMTHPDYRRQGIFVTLAREVYARTAEEGVNLVYGFPKGNSFPAMVKYLDFFVLDQLPAMTRPVNLTAILKQKTKTGFLSALVGAPLQWVFDLLRRRRVGGKDVKVVSFPQFPEAVNGLFGRIAPRFRNLIVRDHEYLSWRYDRNPALSYDRYFAYRGDVLAGYCVCGETERRDVSIGLIVDLFADPGDEDVVATLVQAALDDMQQKGMMTASVVLGPESPFLKTVRRMGFLFPMRRFPFMVRANPGLDPSAVNVPRDWHITLGDGDFV